MPSGDALFKDMTGHVCNGWTVLSYSGNGMWRCRCQCGIEKDVHGQSLRQGRSKSCRRCRFTERTVHDAFKDRVIEGNPDECWPWPRGWRRDGTANYYGTLMVHRKPYPAHRVSWEVYIGPIPERKHVLHNCDNPCCVNPNHLFLGTNIDNINDKVSKGRQAKGQSVRKNHDHLKGEVVVTSRLTAEQVMEIRRRENDGESGSELATEFGMSDTQVGAIVRGKVWKHLPVFNTGERSVRTCPKCGVVLVTRFGKFNHHVRSCGGKS